MRICSMTATFGKLSRQTLHLQQGLNIIEAPNEWGKSTWCAFLMAMLYGIDTGSRSKTGFLADKEHYAPWSGEPMSGSMDIVWNDREITIERRNKGRIPFGEVRAFETRTGVPVPELSVAMPGQVLLGVERSVFARAGFLKLSEMPVTEDESLRRRLNELVTTGDERGTSDDLAQKLRDLKNKCRFNRKGLLPELESRVAEVEQKLQQVHSLQQQVCAITERQETLKEQTKLLENHRQTLDYHTYLQYAKKLETSRMYRDAAAETLTHLEESCRALPSEENIRGDITRLQQLRESRDALHMRAQLLPPLPQMPVGPEVFRGKDVRAVAEEANLDSKTLSQLHKSRKVPIGAILGGVLLLLGMALLLLGKELSVQLGAGLFALCGGVLLFAAGKKRKQIQAQIAALLEKYRPIPEHEWIAAAKAYAQAQTAYDDLLGKRQRELEEINRSLEENTAALTALTGGVSTARFEEECQQQQLLYQQLEEQRQRVRQAEEVVQTLSGADKTVNPPSFADTLTLSEQETDRCLSANAYKYQQLHRQLGECIGQMSALGEEAFLQDSHRQLTARIEMLERYYRALSRAQETVQQAEQELQRRFAPRISQRAQELFSRLTNGRYQKLSLSQDLSVESGAKDENTLRSVLWRSDGTADQLYLALRLAVAEELTPEAPLVLDDALVRFDDTRLLAALTLLQEEAVQKQVVLFTCQSREKTLQMNQEE